MSLRCYQYRGDSKDTDAYFYYDRNGIVSCELYIPALGEFVTIPLEILIERAPLVTNKIIDEINQHIADYYDEETNLADADLKNDILKDDQE